MKESIRTFPFISVSISDSIGTRYDPVDWYRVVRFKTRLRKRDRNGLVYSWVHTRWHHVYELDYQNPHTFQEELTVALSEFISGVYLTMLFGKASPGLTDENGFPVFVPDTDQRDEEDRMRELFAISL